MSEPSGRSTSCGPRPGAGLTLVRAGCLLSLSLLLSGLARAADDDDESSDRSFDIENITLEDLLGPQLGQAVTLSTKTKQRAAQTPAVVTVVSAAEIQARGYMTLADVLRGVPGFYDVYDLVSHNVGVRGISGGPRASGNVIKLMIDGHPVDYRPTTGNYFGEELLPLEAVDRVEVIRGPASALYGANAFLGVINVVLKSGREVAGARVVGRGTLVRDLPGGGLGAQIGHRAGPLDLLLAAHLQHQDRSGLPLPAQSPNPGEAVQRGPSLRDIARPMSVVAKVGLRHVAGGDITLLGSVQRLDASGEFQDFSALTHATRLSNLNQNYRLAYQAAPSERIDLKLSGHYFAAQPTAVERLDTGQPEYLLIRDVGAKGVGASLESRIALQESFVLTAGVDAVSERHRLQTFSQLYRENVLNPDGSTRIKKGALTPVDLASDERTFRSLGAFAQGVLSLGEAWGLTGGARVDLHDIYGAQPSGRLGLVYAPPDSNLSLKLLYGSSFKAPSAEQLYTQPMKILDIRGNQRLQAQTAHTYELFAGLALPDKRAELSLNGFVTDVAGRVEYAQIARFQSALNIQDEWVVGGELEGRFVLAPPLRIRLASGFARTVAKTIGPAIPPGGPDVRSSLFPQLQAHLIADYSLPWLGGHLATEASYIGARTCSQSNALNHGDVYRLPGYVYLALSLSTPARKLWGKRETSAALRISDVADRRWVEPGFGGIDVPTAGRTVSLTVVQQL